MGTSKINAELLKQITVIEPSDDGKFRGVVLFNHDFCGFDGHFENNPIVPGVCLIQLVEIFTQKALKKEILIKNISRMKFKTILKPGDTAEFLLSFLINDSSCITSCTVRVEGSTAAQIKIIFETK